MNMKRWAAGAAAVALIAAAMVYGPAAAELVKEGTAMAAEANEPATASAPAAPAAGQRTISVSGTGKVTVKPDVAHVHFGVMTKAETANEAQTKNAETFAAIEKVLKDTFQVAPEDIRTSGFSVHPEYQWVESRRESIIVGYTASHTVTVAYRDLDGLGKLLDAVSKAGANQVNGIQFGTEKSEAYELQAIEKAMANARAKAEAIAKAAGASVQGVLHVSQGTAGGAPPPIVYPMAKAELAAMDVGSSTSVQPGQLEISTTVSVVYEMK